MAMMAKFNAGDKVRFRAGVKPKTYDRDTTEMLNGCVIEKRVMTIRDKQTMGDMTLYRLVYSIPTLDKTCDLIFWYSSELERAT